MKYIGTKIVEAEPDVCIWKDQKTGDIHIEDGYKITYKDGYVSASPKDVFEEAYRPIEAMNFGLAIEAAKMGHRIARHGWNGEGQYVELGHDFQYDTYNGGIVSYHEDIKGQALVFVGTRGRQVGWLASQADMLADDWYIVGEE